MILQKTLYKIKNNQEIKNGIWLYILQIFNTVVPLFSLPYITRILGPSNYGDFTFSLNLINYLYVVVDYGFDLSVTRKVALNADREYLGMIESTVVFSRLLLTVLCFFIMMAVTLLLSGLNSSQIICCYLLFLSVVGLVLQQTWLFQGLRSMKYITIISVISRIFSLIFMFIWVKRPDDIYLYCIFYSITPLLSGICGFMIVTKRFKIRLQHLNINLILSELRDGWCVFTTQMSSKIFSSINITFLGFMYTSDMVGIFGAIQKIPNVLMLMWMPISQVLYPLSSVKWLQGQKVGWDFIKKYGRIALTLFIALSLLIGMLAKPIITIAFGNAYASYYYIVIPLLVWFIIGVLNNLLGVQGLLAWGKDKAYSKCFQISIFISILIHYVLIKHIGILGAALAPLFSELVLCALLINKIKKTRYQEQP